MSDGFESDDDYYDQDGEARGLRFRVVNKSKSAMLVRVAGREVQSKDDQLSITKGSANVEFSAEIALARSVEESGDFKRVEPKTRHDFHLDDLFVYFTAYKVDGDSAVALAENHATCRASTVYLHDWGTVVLPTAADGIMVHTLALGYHTTCGYNKFKFAASLAVVNKSSQEIRVCVDSAEYTVDNQSTAVEAGALHVEQPTKVSEGVEEIGYSVVASQKFNLFAFPCEGTKQTVYLSLMYKDGDNYVHKCRRQPVELEQVVVFTKDTKKVELYRTSAGVIVEDNGEFKVEKAHEVFSHDVEAQQDADGDLVDEEEWNEVYQ